MMVVAEPPWWTLWGGTSDESAVEIALWSSTRPFGSRDTR